MTKKLIEPEEVRLLREEFLSQEELFLLKFMNSFDRKAHKEWAEKGLWESATAAY
ncbi:MAG: hypothetical protein AABW63_02030 [Nanoarchaeota archaeon]